MIEKKTIIEKLKTCFDPEIPIDLWNLGLIYEIKISNTSDVSILLTLTTPGCSMINIIADDVKEKISSIENVGKVNINITFEPPWSPDMMTENAKIKLGFSKPEEKEEKNINDDWE